MTLMVFVLGGLSIALALRGALERWTGACAYPRGSATWILDWISSTSILALAVWVATSWILALTHSLGAVSLTVVGVVEVVLGALWIARSHPRTTVLLVDDGWGAAMALAVLSPAILWTAFVFWRGTLLPVYNHDGLAYHLPKAVLLLKNGGFKFFDVPEARIATWPWNYELLLSDTMLLTGSDHLTAAISTYGYVTLLLLSARVATGWWGPGPHVAVITALTAAAPLALLHSGLHKNDLFVSSLALGALVWSARWLAVGCRASAALAIVALLLAVGTKANGVFVALAVAPLLVLGVRRHREPTTPRGATLVGVGCVVAALLLGGWPYVANLWRFRALILAPAVTGGQGYGDWSNLWSFPYMALAKPFALPQAVWNPFAHAYWWWPSNDVWMSHFGAPFSVAALLLVPCVVRYRSRGARQERNAASLAALAIVVLTVPIRMRPLGFYASWGRFLMFVVPVVLAWTISPILIDLDHRARWRPFARAIVSLAVVVYVVRSALEFGVHDEYAPIEYVKYEMDHPDDRTPFVRRNRAANVFDSIAGERETCVVDVGYDTWIYPAYGQHWTRTVEFFRGDGDEVVVPEEADWVIVDRTWNVFFGHPGFTDMGKAFALLGRGRPSDADLRVYRRLRKDPRFELVYDDRAQNQALFRRKRDAGVGLPTP